MSDLTRRDFFGASALALATAVPSQGNSQSIQTRGYYFTFCRMPTFSYETWTGILDEIASDGANTVILWMAGGFRSRKYPITWQYNLDHRNIREDFVKRLIDYAHSRHIKVLLGFTPFSYDGTNQYTLEHPELKSVQKNGSLAALSGMHCWGYGLNPSRSEAQKFMLDYVGEMFFDFYPNADGLMIESSDYAICYCPQCSGHYYEREYQFVRAISEEVWRAKPDATILVYPHYFDTDSVPGFQVKGAKMPFDKRWTLFFTPHSAHFNDKLLEMSSGNAIYWDSNPVFKTPQELQQGAQIASTHKMLGYMPSLEAYTFQVKYPEGGESYLEGQRLKPLGFKWLADGQDPYVEPLIRINRIAYRKFTQNPDLPMAEFRSQLGKELWGSDAPAEAVDDLLFLQESFFTRRTWFSPSPVVSPDLLKGRLEMGALTLMQLTDFRDRLVRIRQMALRYRSGAPIEKEIGRISAWIAGNWEGRENLLLAHLR